MKTSCRLNGVQPLNARIAFAVQFFVLVLAALVSGLALHAQSNYATPYTFQTFAGPGGTSSSLDGSGTAASFMFPLAVAIDGSGNLYVSDSGNGLIRKITPAGGVSTLAGSPGIGGSSDGAGSAASFYSVQGIAVDASGTMYVADAFNNTIRKITSSGVVTTLAGSLGVFGDSDGVGSAASFSWPYAMCVDNSGNLYVTEMLSNGIRKITPEGVVSTIAGAAGTYGHADGVGSAATFTNPRGITADASGNLYVADTGNYTIRKVTPAGVVTTIAGFPGVRGYVDSSGGSPTFGNPIAISVDPAGNLFVVDSPSDPGDTMVHLCLIRKVTPAGVVSTVAGGAQGYTNGVGSAAQFSWPNGLAVSASGEVYVADTHNQMIRRIAPDGSVTTLAGGAGAVGYSNGSSSVARFSGPEGVAVDTAGAVYVADTDNIAIRKLTPTGTVSTLLADYVAYNGQLPRYEGVAVDVSGNVYVADSANEVILRVSQDGTAVRLAGGYPPGISVGFADYPTYFAFPGGVAVDATGNVYVADTGNNLIRKISNGTVTNVAGGGPAANGSSDGPATMARFDRPSSLALDASGNIYVADTVNQTIRKITPAGNVTTLAGLAGSSGTDDGTGPSARFYYPKYLAVDTDANVYVSDGSLTVRKITPTGVVTTIGGVPSSYNFSVGTGRAARFAEPAGIAVSSTGKLYVSSHRYNSIMVGSVAALPEITTQPVSQTVSPGQSVTFSVAAASPSTYQWKKNGTVIPGATTASYMIARVLVESVGAYSVVVTNEAGSVSSSTASLSLAPSGGGTIPPGFDVAGYLARYSDVSAVFGADHYGAWLYFRNFGIYQGEVFDDLFRVDEYLALYPELFAIFGSDLGAALDHWLSTGRIEGKLGRIPTEFSASGYFTRNPDVATAVNNNALLAWGHYWLYGIYEGRAYDDELRVFEYLAINADLTAAFVNDWRQAALHWMRYGRTEGRLGRLPLTFNVAEYLNRNPDVLAVFGTNPTTVFLHYWAYGIDEGRTYDDLFRPDEYLTRYPDVAAAVAGDRRGAFKHWVRYGLPGGRIGRYP